MRSDGRLRWSVEVGAPTHGDPLEHHRCATGPACSAARTVVKVSFITILSSAPTSVAPESRARSPESCARGAPLHANAPAAAGGQPGSRPCSELLRPLRGAGGGSAGGPGFLPQCRALVGQTRRAPPPCWGPRAITHATSGKRKVSESGKAIRPASRVPGNGRGEWLVGSDSFVSRIKSGHVYSWAMGVVRTVILADFAAGEQGHFEQLVEIECLFGRGLTLLEGMGTAGTLRNPTNVMSEGAKRALPRDKARGLKCF